MTADVLVIALAFILSFWVRFDSHLFPIPLGRPPFRPYFVGSLVVAFLWVSIFWLLGLYENRSRFAPDEEIYRVAKGTFVGIVAIMAFSFFYREVVWSRLVLAMATELSFFLLSAQRIMAVSIFRRIVAKHGVGLKRTAIIGSGDIALKIIEQLKFNPEYGYGIECLISANGADEPALGETAVKQLEVKKYSEISRLIDEYRLDALFIVLPHDMQSDLNEIVNSAEHRPVEVKFVPDLMDMIGRDTSISQLGNIPVIGLREIPLTEWDLINKRIFDLAAATLGLVVLSPLYLLLAGLIKLTSLGPVFYAQERVGYDGETFNMLKFRSMRMGAEDRTGPVWAKPNDDRRTSLGAFLRKYSLDELPQIFNVIMGDMSLVGPRPERPFFVEKFKDQIPRYASRHKMKSGVTGWAQVNGWRGDTSIVERTKCDIYYIENWSLFLDVKILIRTVLQVIFPRNAY
jgi:Undecaprenyl-phosphate glucose phosphotransferase